MVDLPAILALGKWRQKGEELILACTAYGDFHVKNKTKANNNSNKNNKLKQK